MMFKVFKKAAKTFLLGSLIAAGIFQTADAAKEKPEVVWANDAYSMSISDADANADKKRSYSLLSTGSKEEQEKNRKQISDAISAKLQAQGANLPFKVKTGTDAGNTREQINEQFAGLEQGDIIQLVPLIVTDFAIDQAYTVNGKQYHKYIIISALDIAFCTDKDGVYTILGNIPLHFYTEVPSGAASLEQMSEKSREDLARIYANFTAQQIEKELDFTKYKKMIEGLQDKAYRVETYRVEDVTYTSKRCAQNLGGNKLMQRICGNIFTSDYAAHTGVIVYPMILGDDKTSWVLDAQTGMYSTSINSPSSGEKKLVMPEKIDHKITLDVVGVGSQEIKTKQTSDINYFDLYKLRLLSTITGGKSIEVSNEMVVEKLRDNTNRNRIIKEDPEIFGSLMIGATIQAAAEQAGKKLKKK